ncbi:hypothetical protein [Sinorhizobium fredii]|uniref:hypothetical protein n=1 Tax=Rhizobium fredii TaxID=380 RepID=UPI003513D1ED
MYESESYDRGRQEHIAKAAALAEAERRQREHQRSRDWEGWLGGVIDGRWRRHNRHLKQEFDKLCEHIGRRYGALRCEVAEMFDIANQALAKARRAHQEIQRYHHQFEQMEKRVAALEAELKALKGGASIHAISGGRKL